MMLSIIQGILFYQYFQPQVFRFYDLVNHCSSSNVLTQAVFVGIAQMAHVSNKDGDVNEVDSDDPDCMFKLFSFYGYQRYNSLCICLQSFLNHFLFVVH